MDYAELVQEVVKLDPEDKAGLLSKYLSPELDRRLSAGRYDDAWAVVRAALASNPDRPSLVHMAARVLSQRAAGLRRQGHPDQALAAEREAATYYEKLLTLQPDHAESAAALAAFLIDTQAATQQGLWTVLKPSEMKSAAGATLTRLPDGTILASGKRPDHDTYSIVAPTDLKAVTAIRLEAVPHPDLPGGGPGRSEPNFIVTEVQLTAAPKTEPRRQKRVPLAKASADFVQRQYDLERIIDGDEATAGWAVFPQYGVRHWVMAETADQVAHDAGTLLTIQIACKDPQWKQHCLGRFRLSVTAQAHPGRASCTETLAASAENGWTRLGAAYAVRGEWQAAIPRSPRQQPRAARPVTPTCCWRWPMASSSTPKKPVSGTTGRRPGFRNTGAMRPFENWPWK
jgi:tetratricopeptide (TPR) repeat protein